jgi:hypothetical protein
MVKARWFSFDEETSANGISTIRFAFNVELIRKATGPIGLVGVTAEELKGVIIMLCNARQCIVIAK